MKNKTIMTKPLETSAEAGIAMTDRYERIRDVLADMDAAAEARNFNLNEHRKCLKQYTCPKTQNPLE